MELSQGNDYKQALEALASTIGTKIGKGAEKAESLSSACIFRVPEQIRKLKESAYTPRLVSIGPLHSKDGHLLNSPMQQYVKMNYVNVLLCRVTNGKPDLKFTLLTECLEAMKLLIEDARKCYAEDVDDALDEEMLLIDGCFILEVIYRHYCVTIAKKKHNGGQSKKSSKEGPADPIFDNILASNTVQQDLLLLENQIPFFVLEKLFSLIVDRIPDHHSLTDYVFWYFGNMMAPESKNTNSNDTTTRSCWPSWCGLPSCCDPATECVISVFGYTTNSKEEGPGVTEKSDKKASNYHHILHKLHDDYLPRDTSKEEDDYLPHDTFPRDTSKKEDDYLPCDTSKEDDQLEFTPCASDLDYAGVKFVAGGGEDLFKVKFTQASGPFWWCHRAHFEIPTLGIYDSTEPFLRNLIAFEQCYPKVSRHFTSYAFLMDMLVNSEKDVQVLEKAGAVRNYLGAHEDASDLFNKLCKEIVVGKFFFAGTCKDATEYSKCCWPKFRAHVQRKCFANMWTFIAFCLAFLAFGISVTQFIRSFLK